MNRFSKLALCLAFCLTCTLTTFAQIVPPQGRLTLVSNTPVMTSDVGYPGVTTIYYTPYLGNNLPSSNGTSLSNQTFSQLSVDVSGTEPDEEEDIYAVYLGGAFQLCAVDSFGPDGSTRDSAAGLDLTTLQGIWVNASNLINACYSGSTYYNFSAGQGVYLGSFYSSNVPDGGAGSVGVVAEFKPAPANNGSNNLIGIWNAYNRVRALSVEEDNAANYTYPYPPYGWMPMDESINTGCCNRITYIDGLGQTAVTARLSDWLSGNSVGAQAAIGIDINSITAGPDLTAYYVAPTSTGAYNYHTLSVSDSFAPSQGLNYIQAMESIPSSAFVTFSPSSSVMGLILDTEY